LLALCGVRGDARAVPGGINAALEILRTGERFYDPGLYADAVATVSAALRVVAAAAHASAARLHRIPHALRADHAGRDRARC